LRLPDSGQLNDRVDLPLRQVRSGVCLAMIVRAVTILVGRVLSLGGPSNVVATVVAAVTVPMCSFCVREWRVTFEAVCHKPADSALF